MEIGTFTWREWFVVALVVVAVSLLFWNYARLLGRNYLGTAALKTLFMVVVAVVIFAVFDLLARWALPPSAWRETGSYLVGFVVLNRVWGSAESLFDRLADR